jgi:hypothetical protein
MNSYNLTDDQKELARWLVQQVREENLPEEFHVVWMPNGGEISRFEGDQPTITKGTLDALAANDLLACAPNYKTETTQSGSKVRPKITSREREINRRCTLTGKIYEAVDSDFAAPDTSFVTHLTPLADITSLDNEIKTRCLPILGAGSADPRLWDSAIRTAGVILEDRLRDVGGIADHNRTGQNLVNGVFGQQGTLAGKFTVDSERQGYRDLYAGVVGAFRNPYGHRFVDPAPEDGGAFLVFVNLLLKMLDDLR